MAVRKPIRKYCGKFGVSPTTYIQLGLSGRIIHRDKGIMLLNAVALFLDGEKI